MRNALIAPWFVVCVSIGLAACGDDPPTPPSDGGADGAATDAPPPDATPLEDGSPPTDDGGEDGSTVPDGEVDGGTTTCPRWTWDVTAGGPGRDSIRGTAALSDGTLVAVGYFADQIDLGGGVRRARGNSDGFLVAYGPDGAWRWDRVLGNTDATVQAMALVVDEERSTLYVTGNARGAVDFGGGTRDIGSGGFFVVALAPDGSYRWDRTWSAGTRSNASAISVGLGRSGSVLVGGMLEGTVDLGGGEVSTPGLSTGFLVALSSDGSYLWDRTWVSRRGMSSVHAVAAGQDGRIALVGRYRGEVDFGGGPRSSASRDEDAFVLVLDETGSYTWDVTWGGDMADWATDVLVTSDGSLRVLGFFQDAVDFGGGERTAPNTLGRFLVALGSDGTWQWDRVLGGTPAEVSASGKLAALSSDAVLVAASFQGRLELDGALLEAAAPSGLLVALDEAGAPMWHHTWVASDGSAMLPMQPAPLPDGSVVVGGSFEGTVDLGGGPRTANDRTDVFLVRVEPCPAMP